MTSEHPEWSTTSEFLLAIGVSPANCTLYRHAGKPRAAPGVLASLPSISQQIEKRQARGRDHLLSFLTYHSERRAKQLAARTYCLHFLGETPGGGRVLGQFLGMTETLGDARPFDVTESEIVDGYLPGEADPMPEGDNRWSVPLRWADADLWGFIDTPMLIDWEGGALAATQTADEHPKPILSGRLRKEFRIPNPESLHDAPPNHLAYESRIARTHLVFERRVASSRWVKARKGLICESCGLDGKAAFGAELAMSAMEAHHLVPVAQMPEAGRTVSTVDFAVLCATCHRLIHRLESPDDLDGLRKLVRGEGPGAGLPWLS